MLNVHDIHSQMMHQNTTLTCGDKHLTANKPITMIPSLSYRPSSQSGIVNAVYQFDRYCNRALMRRSSTICSLRRGVLSIVVVDPSSRSISTDFFAYCIANPPSFSVQVFFLPTPYGFPPFEARGTPLPPTPLGLSLVELNRKTT